MAPMLSLALVLCFKSDVSVVLNDIAVRVLSEMEEREGGKEDPRDPSSLPVHPRRGPKWAHMPLFHIVTDSCYPLRRRMLFLYAILIPMVNVIRLMIGPRRTSDTGTENLLCMGWGDPRSNHSKVDSTLDM